MASSTTINIDSCFIGDGCPPYIVAEISANHNGKLSTAKELISAAKSAGANAIKLQTYSADTLTLNCDSTDFRIKGGLWDGKTLHQLYSEAQMPWEWHSPLFSHARKEGITIFSSPFDRTAVDLLEDLNTPAYKIASFEAIDLPLIKYAASTKKPLIISTGMATEIEIQEAIDAAKSAGCTQLALLHCVSGYPAPAIDYNLRTIPDMIQRYGHVTGLSDHTLSNATAIASIAMGASIIEKHFTLNRAGGGPDDSFSLEPDQLSQLCLDTKTAWEAMGNVNYERKLSEQNNVKFRRSLYFVKDIKKGEIITEDCIRSVRPGYGLPPKALTEIIGKRALMDIKINTASEEEHYG
jgi:pseudaminic acid synthase